MRTNPETADHLRTTAVREPFVGAYSYYDVPPSNDLYFIKSASGHCKIGRSGNVAARLKKLATASPFPLELVMILKGHGWQERVWHTAFAHQRHNLEWFRWGGGLKRAIEAMRKPTREMKDAALVYMDRHCPHRAKETAWDATCAWSVMIDAALAPAQTPPPTPQDESK